MRTRKAPNCFQIKKICGQFIIDMFENQKFFIYFYYFSTKIKITFMNCRKSFTFSNIFASLFNVA